MMLLGGVHPADGIGWHAFGKARNCRKIDFGLAAATSKSAARKTGDVGSSCTANTAYPHHRRRAMAITHAITGTDPKVSINYPDGSLIVRAAHLPWTPWGMPGTQFKLLHCDDATGLLVILLKVQPGTVAGVHKHFGAAHAFIVEGGFGYEHGEVYAGDYLVEAGGITHQPFTGPNGLVLLGFMFGPLGGFDDKGQLAGVLDIDWHYNAAKANGAADHIMRKVSQTH
jgi:2,4'-dihydroxyacetophenone dioxygenase